MRFRITSVDPSSRINCFFLKSLNRRVTVSLDAPIICAISAPSSLAVSLAAEFGMTLIGFLRGERFNVYTGTERVHVGNLD